jgi:hypothetical protein
MVVVCYALFVSGYLTHILPVVYYRTVFDRVVENVAWKQAYSLGLCFWGILVPFFFVSGERLVSRNKIYI